MLILCCGICPRLQVGDFAILLRAGFDRCSAARMQLSTALVGVLGACFALCAQSPKGTGKTLHILHKQSTRFTVARMTRKSFLPFVENATAWILPFTSGGFLYIALVNVVPDLLEESSLRYASFVLVHITNTMGSHLLKRGLFNLVCRVGVETAVTMSGIVFTDGTLHVLFCGVEMGRWHFSCKSLTLCPLLLFLYQAVFSADPAHFLWRGCHGCALCHR